MPETLLNSTDVQSNEIPKTVLGLEEKYKQQDQKTVRAENITESLVDSLPEPSGWRLLVLPFTPCLLYTSPSPRDRQKSRMPSSA